MAGRARSAHPARTPLHLCPSGVAEDRKRPLEERPPMFRPRHAATITAMTLLLAALKAHAHHEDELNDHLRTYKYNYDIFYTDDSPWNCGDPNDAPAGSESDYFPASQALNVANALDSLATGAPGTPSGVHEGYVDLGFRAPSFDGRDDE